MNRLENLAQSIKSERINANSDDDVVICSAVRTPFTRAKKGGLKNTAPEQMLAVVFREAAARAKINPSLVEDIVVGNNSQPGAGEVTSRMASFLGGFPETTTIVSINRMCSSGLEACSIIASKIRSGFIDIGMGSGVESMSLFEMNDAVKIDAISQDAFDHPRAVSCLTNMGQTSENVAEKYGITREQQDQMAVQSHRRAYQAQQKGYFDQEIVPVKTKIIDDKGNEVEITVTKDDGIRKQTTMKTLSKLKTVFKQNGTTTAGNSSQVTDGAAAVVFARRSVAKKLGMPILGKFIGYTVKGCQPTLMGIGPTVAIPALLSKHNKKINDIDIWEINEAFASQATYCVQHLGIDFKKVNPKGGAIAFGHPLGCTGARQIATLLTELKRTKGKFGVISMCIGTGMGAAALIENEQL